MNNIFVEHYDISNYTHHTIHSMAKIATEDSNSAILKLYNLQDLSLDSSYFDNKNNVVRSLCANARLSNIPYSVLYDKDKPLAVIMFVKDEDDEYFVEIIWGKYDGVDFNAVNKKLLHV